MYKEAKYKLMNMQTTSKAVFFIFRCILSFKPLQKQTKITQLSLLLFPVYKSGD